MIERHTCPVCNGAPHDDRRGTPEHWCENRTDTYSNGHGVQRREHYGVMQTDDGTNTTETHAGAIWTGLGAP